MSDAAGEAGKAYAAAAARYFSLNTYHAELLEQVMTDSPQQMILSSSCQKERNTELDGLGVFRGRFSQVKILLLFVRNAQ